MTRRSLRLPRAVSGAGLAALMLIAGGSNRAQAAGVEDAVGGTVALGRQANYARVTDFMAVWQNPANLSLAAGKDIGLDVRMPAFNGCFERKQDPSVSYLSTESFKKTCSKGVGLTGNLGFVLPLPRGFGFGVGLFTPSGTPHLKFGNSDLNTVNGAVNEKLPITTGKSESPGRFLLIDKTVTAAWLMVGAGYAPTKYLRFGVSIGSGFVDVGYKNVTSLLGGTLTDAAIVSDVHVTDAFVPRATLSVAASPLDSVDLMASFTWNDDIHAKGNLDVTANGLKSPTRGDCAAAAPGPRCRVKDVSLDVPYQRYEIVLGGRYAKRNKPREKVLDPSKDEVWDVEINGLWSQTSHVDNFTLNIWNGMTGTPAQRSIQLSSSDNTPLSPLPNKAQLYHGWRDTYGLRVGGDYNVIPALLALRAGLAYESSAVPAKNMNIDYWPVQKVTLSCGATIKLQRWKLHAAYAHVFAETVTAAVGTGQVKEVVAINQPAAQAVNEGKYSSRLNLVSIQANYTF